MQQNNINNNDTSGYIQGIIGSPLQITGVLLSVQPIYGTIDKTYISPSEKYSGSYTVTPKVTQQVLETMGFYMEDDLTITAIPFSETFNPYGGNTITIG